MTTVETIKKVIGISISIKGVKKHNVKHGCLLQKKY